MTIITNKAWEFCEDIQEEKDFYNSILESIYKDPRFYLENLDDPRVLQTYRFSFINYSYKKKKAL